MKKPKAIKKLTDVQPQPSNANRHTPRGESMLEGSMRELGYADSITVTSDAVVISGNSRTETAVDLGMVDPIVVQSDGSRPIIHQRTDLVSTDPKAKRLALMSNRVSELNLNWDPDVIGGIEPDITAGLWTDEEIAVILDQPDEVPAPDDEAAQKAPQTVTCPKCSHTFTPDRG